MARLEPGTYTAKKGMTPEKLKVRAKIAAEAAKLREENPCNVRIWKAYPQF